MYDAVLEQDHDGLPYYAEPQNSLPVEEVKIYLGKIGLCHDYLVGGCINADEQCGDIKRIVKAVDDLFAILLLAEISNQRQWMSLPQPENILTEQQCLSPRKVAEYICEHLDCTILQHVFSPVQFETMELPPDFIRSQWRQYYRAATDQLFAVSLLPLSFLGDYHQFCLSRRTVNYEQKPIPRLSGANTIRYANGSHYTPTAVVDYITAKALNPFLQNLTLESLWQIRIMDPSCGCGAFLVAAFRCVINCMESSRFYNAPLSIQQQLDLIASILFGSDIDSRACNWTIILLLLAVKEHTGDQNISGNSQVDIPDLTMNIKCGDFLDFVPDSNCPLVDVILGGPLFVRLHELHKSEHYDIDELKTTFETAKSGQFDLYILFIEKSLNILSDGGRLAFSVSNTFLRSISGESLRLFIGRHSTVREIIEIDDSRLYPDARTQIALLFLNKSNNDDPVKYARIARSGSIRQKLNTCYLDRKDHSDVSGYVLQSNVFSGKQWLLASNDDSKWLSMVKLRSKRLVDVTDVVTRGGSTGADEILLLQQLTQLSDEYVIAKSSILGRPIKLEAGILREVIRAKNISGYGQLNTDYRYVYPYNDDGRIIDEDKLSGMYPMAYQYLSVFKDELCRRKLSKGLPWYALCNNPGLTTIGFKLVSGIIDGGCGFTIDTSDGVLCHNGVLVIVPNQSINPWYLLGIVNSNAFWRYVMLTAPTLGDKHYALRIGHIKEFPFIDDVSHESHELHDYIAGMARSLIEEPHSNKSREMAICEINIAVNELYG